MIDLHTHTTYSDGTWDLKKILKEAEKSGITILSITDHDTVDVYSDVWNIIKNREDKSNKEVNTLVLATLLDNELEKV